MATKKKIVATQAAVAAAKTPRRFTPASFTTRRLRRRAERSNMVPLLPARVIFWRGLRIIWDHWEIFGGLMLIYAVINLVLVGGLSGGIDLQSIKDNITGTFSGHLSNVRAGFTLFAFLIASGNTTASGVASAYQTLTLIVFSLAFVWALRQLAAGNRVRVRDTLYSSTYPLIQVLLVLMVVTFHLMPSVIGSYGYATLTTGGILNAGWQQALTGFGLFLLICWTAYLLCHSLIAMYIVTLPDMTPLKALRSAKQIVRHRRGAVLRKLLFLPFILLLVAAVIMVPLSALFTSAAVPVFFVYSIICLPVFHSYMYVLYRELIK